MKHSSEETDRSRRIRPETLEQGRVWSGVPRDVSADVDGAIHDLHMTAKRTEERLCLGAVAVAHKDVQ